MLNEQTACKMKKFICIILLITGISISNISHAEVDPPRNPDSAKECAICHYRWIDTFFIDGKGSDLVDYQSEKVVATPEICFSCHDGSVVDSRARVYNDFRHKINRPPTPDMKLPKIFPLDKNGNMQCFTCHTAHGVPSEMGIEKTIFIRTSNENSAMCKMCHDDKDGGIAYGNHPIGPQEKKIPEILIKHGARSGDGKNHVICETCHTVHGSPNESFLIESARISRLCLECHADKKIFTPDGRRNHLHVVNVRPKNVKIPDEVMNRGAKLGYNGEIICQTCHKIHNNNFEKKLLLIMKDERSTLCMTCHTDKQYIKDTKHNLIHTAPEEKNLDGKTVAQGGICSACHLPHREARKTGTSGDFITQLCLSCHSKGDVAEEVIPAEYRHPMDINPFKEESLARGLAVDRAQEEKLTLPLYDKYGLQDKNGIITCTTCHDPHKWRSDSNRGEISRKVKGDGRTSFLRRPAPEICGECHNNKFQVADSKHDMTRMAPDMKNSRNQTPSESGLCGACHLVHGGNKGYLWAREIITYSGNIVQDLCVGCHNARGIAKDKIIKEYSHPINISPYKKGISTTLPLFNEEGTLSDRGLMTCETCHDPHRWNPSIKLNEAHYKVEGNAQNSFLRIQNFPSPALCEDCHPQQSIVEKTDHDLSITAPKAKNIAGQIPSESGVCGVCHIVHNGPHSLKLWAQDLSKGSSVMNRMCNGCHSEDGPGREKIPEVESHPEGKLISNAGRDIKGEPNYFPLFDKITGENISSGNISCPSCHDVHQWDPRVFAKGSGINEEGTATNSFLRPQTYSLLCIDCHGLEALFRFKYYHDPGERLGNTERSLWPGMIE